MVQWVLDACRQGGCDQQVVVVGHQREKVAEVVAAQMTWFAPSKINN